MIHRRISDSPDPAAPVNRGEPLNTIARRAPPSSGRFILEIMCWRNRKLPSLIRGVPAPNRPDVAFGFVFGLDVVGDHLPLHPERRVGEQVVETAVGVLVVVEAVTEPDPGRVLTFDQHVSPTRGVGLGVDLLPVHLQGGPGG